MNTATSLNQQIPNSKTKFGLLLSVSLLSALNCHVASARELPGAVASIRGEQIDRISGNALTGRISGNALDTDAILRLAPTYQPGQGDLTTNVTIRGFRGGAATDPLIIVDGVIAADGAMANLDPTFIENMQVLKGASATAIYGSRAAAGVVIITTKAQVGYTDNPWRDKGGDKDSSGFLSGGIGVTLGFKNGDTSLTLGADIGYTQYEANFDRNGDDEHDLNFSYLFDHKFSDVFAIRSYASLHSGAHQSIERGYQRTGLGLSNSTDWYSRTSGHYSLDGKGMGTGGIEGETAFIFKGVDESDFDHNDVMYQGFEQRFFVGLQDGTQVGITAAYGMTEWKQRQDFDADVLKVGGFLRQDLGSGFSATIFAGWEQRDYGKLDIKRDDFYINGTIGGPLVKDKIWFFAVADYGVQQNYLNANSSNNWIDPIGLRVATGLRVTDVGPGTLAVDARVQHLESDLLAGPSQSIKNYSLELSYVFSMSGVQIAPSITYFNDDFDNGNDSDGFAFSLSMIKQF